MGLNIDFENREVLTITDFEFLSLFKKPNENVYFRLIQEKKRIAKKFDCILTLDDDLEYPLIQKIFKRYQKQGYSVYFVVNSGGQEKNSIKRINAHFIDMDFRKVPKIDGGKLTTDSEGKTVYEYRSKEEIEEYKIAFLKKLENFKLNPNIIVETKNGFHVYWLLNLEKPQRLDAFTPLQENLIEYFAALEERHEHADNNVKEFNRVLRIINYQHLKNPNDPFTIKCIYLNTDVKYTQEDIAAAIGYNIIELVGNTESTEIKPVTVRTEINNLRKESPKVHSSPVLQYDDLIPFLKQQDLISYPGIDAKPNLNFKCIFHKDNNPSAVIKSKGGYYKYFCNSPVCTCYNAGKGMDIIDIFKIKENCDTSTAIRKLIEYFHIKLEDSTWINEQSKKFEINMMLLSQFGEKKDEFPNLNRIIRFGISLLMDILEIGKENIINRFFSTNGESIFFFSNRYLAGKRNKSVVNINKYINLFCTLGLLNKIPYKQVNQRLRAMAVQISKDNAQKMYKFVHKFGILLFVGGIPAMKNLLGQISILKAMEIKPNFSELAREYGVDRRTVKKYYEGYEGKPKTRNKQSKLDKYYDEIKAKLEIKGVTVKGVYEYFVSKNYDIGTYSNFNKYVKRKGLKPAKKVSGHPRFETPAEKQAQVDWKEEIKLVSKYGEEFIFNVFNYKLGYSRYCYFEYRKAKTQQDVIECLINAFKATGGVPDEILFDNMKTIVDITNEGRKINNKIKAFANDFDFKIRLCKPRHSYTKGNVESSNKFIDWLLPYNGEFENEEDLIKIIGEINKKVNQSTNQSTGIQPIILFQKEKEYLSPLPSNDIIESYMNFEQKATVHKDSMIYYKYSRYSINKTVTLKTVENELHVYFNTDLISVHILSDKKINYHESHYRELIENLIKSKEDIEQICTNNLNELDKLLHR